MLSLCHTVVRAPESSSPGGAFPDQKCGWSNGRMTECRTRKNTEVEMLPVEGLFKESAKYVYFVGATTKLCQCRCCRRCCFIFHIKNLSINLKSSNSSILLPTNIRIALSQVCRRVTPKCRKVGCSCVCPVGAPNRKRPTPAGLCSPVFLFFFVERPPTYY